MKKFLLIMVFVLVSTSFAQAFLYEIQVKSREEIHKLSDRDLEEAYIEARIEEKASSQFHESAGFSNTKEYTKFKQLLRYLFELRREMGLRQEIKADSIDLYLD